MQVDIQPGFKFVTFFVLLAAAATAVPSLAHAQTFTVLYNFGEPASGYDATANVIFDPARESLQHYRPRRRESLQ